MRASVPFFVPSLFSLGRGLSCKCGPSDTCWPNEAQWNSLNSSVNGQLIATQPLAVSCYPGPDQNSAQCATVDQGWTNASFQADSPVGLSYPIDVSCPPVNATAGQQPATCTIGTSPRYAVNATCVEEISAAVRFAKKHNVRLVIKDTGHDLLGRSTGYGSLEVWIRHLRTGLKFEPEFQSCSTTGWKGAAIAVGGGYTWVDVYPLAEENNVVVVGGGTPTVSVLGGWMQGGGHGPASRPYGLGADQVLSAQVVLADGSTITASPCENQDVYFAIRGGGPGTYGVVTSTIIKAWPMVDVQMQSLAIAPLSSSDKDISAFLDTVAILYAAFPDLNDAGLTGYGTWSIASAAPLVGNSTVGYVHGLYTFNQTPEAGQKVFAPTLDKLKQHNSSVSVSLTHSTYPDYWTFYWTAAAVEPLVGAAGILGSRLFSRHSVKNHTSLREMIGIIAGAPDEYTSNSLEVIGGGAVFSDGSEKLSGVNPAWRISYFNSIVARGAAPGSSQSVVDAIQHDITYVKTEAMKKQAPDTGAYMNEADRLDPDYEHDFYGKHYKRLYGIKARYDPTGVFYCPTCVGSSEWTESSSGALCPVKRT